MKKQGFTLIELMVVISIIGFLAAIALPRFTGVTDSAKAAQIQGNLANLRTAIGMFHAKTGEYPDFSKIEESSNLNDIKVGDIKFTDFYSKSKMPIVPAWKDEDGDIHESANFVVTGETFTGDGGWLYIFNENTDSYGNNGNNKDKGKAPDNSNKKDKDDTEKGKNNNYKRNTGEIYVNITTDPNFDPFGQGVDWTQY